jgi:hypothetical protein
MESLKEVVTAGAAKRVAIVVAVVVATVVLAVLADMALDALVTVGRQAAERWRF